MWTEIEIGEAVELILDHRGRTPKKLGADFVPDGIQVISAQNITSNRLDLSATARFVSIEVADRWMPAPLAPGDVLLSSEAPLGCVARIGDRMERLCLGQRLFALRPNASLLDATYLEAALRSDPVRNRLLSRASGTTAQGIKQSELRQVLLPLPPLSDQRAIASVLGALDEKIESNRRCWQSQHDLLPALYEGSIRKPAAWGTIGELGTIVGGGTPKSSEPSYWEPPDVAWITPKDMTALSGAPVIRGGARGISKAGLAASSAKLLPGGSVAYTSRATLGLIAVAQSELATNQGFISVVPDPRFGSAFVYCSLLASQDQINALASGSTFMEVNKTNFRSVACPFPTEEALLGFRESAEALLDGIAVLLDESGTLTAIRDALLPKLVFGKIRVPLSEDPEEQVAAAVEGLGA